MGSGHRRRDPGTAILADSCITARSSPSAGRAPAREPPRRIETRSRRRRPAFTSAAALQRSRQGPHRPAASHGGPRDRTPAPGARHPSSAPGIPGPGRIRSPASQTRRPYENGRRDGQCPGVPHPREVLLRRPLDRTRSNTACHSRAGNTRTGRARIKPWPTTFANSSRTGPAAPSGPPSQRARQAAATYLTRSVTALRVRLCPPGTPLSTATGPAEIRHPMSVAAHHRCSAAITASDWRAEILPASWRLMITHVLWWNLREARAAAAFCAGLLTSSPPPRIALVVGSGRPIDSGTSSVNREQDLHLLPHCGRHTIRVGIALSRRQIRTAGMKIAYTPQKPSNKMLSATVMTIS